MRAACTIRRRFPVRKVIVTTALLTQGDAGSTHCEVLPLPEGRLSGRDARSGHGRSAQSSCLVSETLTAREHDILVMISQGLSNKRIARAREISPETVKSHVKHIFSKLAVGTRAQAVFQAGSLGLLRGGNLRHEEARRSVSRSTVLRVVSDVSLRPRADSRHSCNSADQPGGAPGITPV